MKAFIYTLKLFAPNSPPSSQGFFSNILSRTFHHLPLVASSQSRGHHLPVRSWAPLPPSHPHPAHSLLLTRPVLPAPAWHPLPATTAIMNNQTCFLATPSAVLSAPGPSSPILRVPRSHTLMLASWAVVTKDHDPPQKVVQNKRSVSRSPGDQKSKPQVLAGRVPAEPCRGGFLFASPGFWCCQQRLVFLGRQTHHSSPSLCLLRRFPPRLCLFF